MIVRRTPRWPDPRVKPPYGSVEIDWAHPLAVGLVHCWLFNEGAPAPVNLVRPKALTPVNAPKIEPGAKGLALSVVRGSLQYVQTDTNLTNDEQPVHPLTVMAMVRPTGSFTEFSNALFKVDVGGNGQYGILTIGSGQWRAQQSTGTDLIGSVLSLDVDYILAYTITAGGTGTPYRNGLVDGSTVASCTVTRHTSKLTIGGDSHYGRYWNGLIYLTYMFSGAKPADEMRWLAAEPYAFLRPILRRRYFVPGGARVVPRRLPMLGVGA